MELIRPTVLSPEILAQIRRLHFQTKRLADEGIAGQYRSAFRGRGIEFEEVREYVPGDDIRSIDWKVTARSRKPYVKSYREERELTVMIAVDVSASTLTGTRNQLRDTLIAQVGAVLTLIALKNNDKVGLVTYSDRLETFHPPRKARSAGWRILHEVFSEGSYHPRTDLKGLFSFLSRVLKRSSIVFIISDFCDGGYEKELAVLAKRHDVTAITVADPADFKLPRVSLVTLKDLETGKNYLIDSSDEAFQARYAAEAAKAQKLQRDLFNKYGVGSIEIATDRPFIHDLKIYFSGKRGRRRFAARK